MKTKLLLIIFALGITVSYAQNEFITTWKTDNPGLSNDNQITIPTFSGETYDYTVDWGDGNSDTGVTGNITHVYASIGTYTVTITGLFPRIYFSGPPSINLDKAKILTIEQWGNNPWTSMEWAFESCVNLNITNPSIDSPDLSNVIDLTGMFASCSAFNGDLSNWDVSNVEQMSEMFYACFNFNSDISAWDVRNVIDMSYLFSEASSFNQDIGSWDLSNAEYISNMFDYAEAFNQDISSWDVSKAQSLVAMFSHATAFNQDISSWDVSNVQNMTSVFSGATAFDKNLGSWDIGAVTNMSNMFGNAGLSTSNYDATLMGWATDASGTPGDDLDDIPSNLTFDGGSSMYCVSEHLRSELTSTYNWIVTDAGLDTECTNGFITTWKTDIPDASNDNQITITTKPGRTYNYSVDWGDGTSSTGLIGNMIHTYPDDDGKVIYTVKITGLFPSMDFDVPNNDKDKILTIEQWGDNPWSIMSSAFDGCKNINITNPNIDAPNLSNVSGLDSMFAGCINFNGDVSNWNVSNIEDMSAMFFNTSFNKDISSWNVSSVKTMGGMFKSATDFNQNIGGWNTGNVIDMSDMFDGATAFNQNLGAWDIKSVEYMQGMLSNASLSTTNYDATLIGWATDSSGTPGDSIDDIPMDITFSGGNSLYCNGESARTDLESTHGWVITDGGLDCSSLSINDFDMIDSLKIFPNPASSNVNINLPIGVSLKQAILYNISGVKVKTITSTTFNISDIAMGVYLFVIETNKDVITKKVVKI